MAGKHIMPMTKLGKWGFWLVVAAAGLVLLSMATALLGQNAEENTAMNVLGVLAPAFVSVSVAGIVVSWIAIFRGKDRGILLIIFASVLTAIALFFAVGEVIEAFMMG